MMEDMPESIYVQEDTLYHNYRNSFQTDSTVKYTRDDIYQSALDRIKQLEAFIYSRGYEVPK